MTFRRKGVIWGLSMLTLLGAVGSPALASAYSYGSQEMKPNDTKYQRPEDLIDLVPVLSAIPRSFLFGDGYRMKLNGQELQIDHMGFRSNSPAKTRNCLIFLSYSAPTSFFGSRIDLPLFHSEDLRPSDWASSSMNDYSLHFSKNPAFSHPTLQLLATAHF